MAVAPRFPLRVELSSFARALGSAGADKVNSLLEYLTQRIRASRTLQTESVFEWLTVYPWLLILDGLDEVPSSSNRDLVCRAIQDFIAEATLHNANILLLATTRMEGYNNELGEKSHTYRYLAPLSLARALDYAEQFGASKFGVDSSRVAEMLEILKQSAKDDLTAKLLRTPLQVTFLATLVAAGGRPPRDRWKLFHDYYETIYKREQQKCDGELNSVLTNQDGLIHRLHHDVGFLLQLRGEEAGGTEAMMPISDFQKLIESYLTEDEWEEPARRNITDLISNAARTRLVFLSSRVAGKLSFDVRSLQEYMAAERLSSGDEKQVLQRIRTIAPYPYWRNVFLFVAGKCFARPELEHLRASIKEICEELNEPENGLSSISFVGADLAQDLLEDGAVAHIPKYAKAFTRLALQRLDRAIDFEDRRHRERLVGLTGTYEPRFDEIFRHEITNRLRNPEVHCALTAWAFLFYLADRGGSLAEELGPKYWPKDEKQAAQILTNLELEKIPPWLLERIKSLLPKIDPHSFPSPMWSNFEPAVLEKSEQWFSAALDVLCCAKSFSEVNLSLDGAFPLSVKLKYIRLELNHERETSSWVHLADMPNPSSSWLPYLSVSKFYKTPTKEKLAEVIAEIGSTCSNESLRKIVRRNIPWPLSCLIAYLWSAGANVDETVTAIRNGEFGDNPDWHFAEERWREKGIKLDDFKMSPSKYPFDKNVVQHGFAFPVTDASYTAELGRPDAARCLIEAISDCKNIWAIEELHDSLLQSIAMNREDEAGKEIYTLLKPAWLKRLFERIPNSYFELRFLFAFDWPDNLDPEWLELCDWIGRERSLFYPVDTLKPCKLVDQLAGSYAARPELQGVLRFLALFAVMGYEVNVPKDLLNLARFTEARFQLSALLIQLRQQKWDVDEAKCLASNALTLHTKDLNACNTIIQLVKKTKNTSPELEKFIETLVKGLPVNETSERAELQSTAAMILKRRKSELQNIMTRKQMHLPTLI